MQYVGATKYEELSAVDIKTMLHARADSLFTLNDTKTPDEFTSIRQIYINLDYVEPYVDSAIEIIDKTKSEYYVLHDLPNTKDYGYGWAWQSASSFSGWWQACAQAIKKARPGIQLGYPKLKVGDDIELVQHSNYKFLCGTAGAINAADFMTVGTSWGCDSKWGEMYRALYYIVYVWHTFHKPIMVLYCNSNNNVRKSVKGDQYVEFLENLHNIDSVTGAFCHTLSSPVRGNKWVAWRTAKKESSIPTKIAERKF